MDQPHRDRTVLADRDHDIRGVVGGIVDEQDVRILALERGGDPGDQRLDVRGLIEGRNDDGDAHEQGTHSDAEGGTTITMSGSDRALRDMNAPYRECLCGASRGPGGEARC